MAAARPGASRKVTCCSHGRPIMTRRPLRCAASRSQRGGTVYVRTEFRPFVAIWARSRSTTSGEGYSSPGGPRRNVPYVAPRIQNFSSPTNRNFPADLGLGKVTLPGVVGTGDLKRAPRDRDYVSSLPRGSVKRALGHE